MNAIGAIIVASFAVFWVGAGAHQFPGRWFVSVFGLSFLISAAIVLAATRIPFGRNSAGFDGKLYGIFVTLEAVAIICAVVLLRRAGKKEFVIPVIALIVGLHFFGMVPALHSNEFWWVGGAMCALSILTMSVLPRRIWAPVTGIGCALILWLSAIRAFF
ncbi:MAG TPA: hypothetical protein VEI58_00500 [Chthoniobacterales bacterium]|nr:hypothetical protein [Chthoniobacterales bacterium]